MRKPTIWDEFMNRVIEAQRQISKRGGVPSAYRVVVAPAYYYRLMACATETGAYTSHLDFHVTDEVAVGEVLLRHEVKA